MSFILRWILGKMNGLLADIFRLIGEISQSAFDNPAVKGILAAFKLVGLPLIGVAILVLVAKKIIAIADGEGVSLGDMITRMVVGAITYQYGITIAKYLYLMLIEISADVITAITGNQAFSTDIQGVLSEATFGELFVLVLMLVSIFYLMKSIMSLMERFWLLLITLCLMYLYLVGYIAGNDEGLVMWFKQVLSIGLTQLFQTTVLVLGMSMFVGTGNASDFFLAVGAIIASTKVDQVLDKYGMSSGGKLGGAARNGMSMAFYGKQMLGK